MADSFVCGDVGSFVWSRYENEVARMEIERVINVRFLGNTQAGECGGARWMGDETEVESTFLFRKRYIMSCQCKKV